MKFFWKRSPTQRHLDKHKEPRTPIDKSSNCRCGIFTTSFHLYGSNTLGFVTCERCGREKNLAEAFNNLAQQMISLKNELQAMLQQGRSIK